MGPGAVRRYLIKPARVEGKVRKMNCHQVIPFRIWTIGPGRAPRQARKRKTKKMRAGLV